jgi:CRP-like cAMP-binding protein
VVRLSSGQSFGEKALIEDAPRAATIVALSESYFAVVGREDYKKGLQRIEQRAA